MLTKDEWRKTAELAAAAEDGRKHAGWLKFKRFGAVPVSILAVAGAIGLGAWWMFAHVFGPLVSGDGPHLGGRLPFGFLLVVLLALVGTIVAFRVEVPSAPFLIARLIATVFVWLGLVAFALAAVA